ncbi:MAG: ROK family protein [Devosia sp.]|nr:ROK family protein [Devosia sp.]
MANQTLVRHVNERRLLTVLRVEGARPRAALARRLSLTRAAVTSMIDDLLKRGLVREIASPQDPIPGKRDVGRPGIDVGLNPGGAHFLGVEIGVGAVRFALFDLSAEVVDTEAVPLPEAPSPADVVSLVARKLADLRSKKLCRETVRAVGVTVPGLVRSDGYVINLPILGWKKLNLARMLDQELDVPCYVENNANAAAFGEIYSSPRPNDAVVVYLKLGTGCGGAVIINDRLLRGADGLGTEFGHIHIESDGPLCSCGQRGCLETFVNLKALQRYFTREEVDEFHVDLRLPGKIAVLLTKQDPEARKAVDELSAHLAKGLINITNIFNPSEIVLGGAMLPILAEVCEAMKQPLRRGIIPGMTVPTLTVSRLGEFECAIGAAATAHHEEFDLSNLDLST